jgi:hypothetical protein|nr:MAG TPA_asm: hypothetical protein [Caudoviricetes sp.]
MKVKVRDIGMLYQLMDNYCQRTNECKDCCYDGLCFKFDTIELIVDDDEYREFVRKVYYDRYV